jgi:D-3-phosphoglycerate dehydrogenase
MKVLVADKLSPAGLQWLEGQDDVEVDVKTGLTPEELAGTIGEYDGMIIRSAVKVTPDVLADRGQLKCIARAGVGVDNIDVETATKKGIIVMNTPGGNTLATAELTWALILGLSRNIVPAALSLREGKWERKKFQGTQVAGKTLGVVGMGRIGSAVAKRALAMEMRVLAYDPYFGGAVPEGPFEMVKSLDELCRRADYLTVHVTKSPETEGMIGAERIERMKDGVRLINAARGGIIDPKALLDGLQSGKVAAAALDVWTSEPPESETEQALIAHPNVLGVPHLGASTEEAQEQVALDAAEQLVEALRGGQIRNALNAPGFDRGLSPLMRRYAELAERMGVILAAITPGAPRQVEVVFRGAISSENTSVLTTYLTLGLLRPHVETVNIVNAPVVARDRGVEVEVVSASRSKDFSSVIEVDVETDEIRRGAYGTVFANKFPRIISLDGYRMEMQPEGPLAIMFGDDRPGVIGTVGSVFGEAGVNIASMTFGRKVSTQKSVLAVNLDSPAPQAVIDRLLKLEFMDAVYTMELPMLSRLE